MLCASFLLSWAPVYAQRGYPSIETVYPGAVTRGQTTEVFLRGRYNLREAYRVLFEGDDITATVLDWQDLSDPEKGKEKPGTYGPEGLRLRVTAAEDAVPGIRPFRILTKGSLSALAHLLVTRAPCVTESEPNDSTTNAQTIGVPETVNGLLDQVADTDVYKFAAKAGQRVSFIVHAARLQRPVPNLERNYSDVMISLRDADDNELAAADDWKGQDPRLFYTFEKDGVYYLHLREARYHSGKEKWWYALSLLTTPYVTSVFPPVAEPGSKVSLQLEGFNLDAVDGYEVDVPADATGQIEFQVESPLGSSNLVSLAISDLPLSIEANSPGPVDIELPVGMSGRVLEEGEIDRYRFSARKGEHFEFQAHRYHSLLDPLMELYDARGRLLAADDDEVITLGQGAHGGLAFPVDKDARIEWTAPEDGRYEVWIRDANYFGSQDHVYHLVARHQQPDFALIVDDDRMPLGPGESVTSLVTVERRNGFSGPVELLVRGLPEGVVAHRSVIPSHLAQGRIVLTAAPAAKLDSKNVEVVGRSEVRLSDGRSREIERVAKPHAPMGQAGGRSFYPVQSVTVAVTEGSDIIMEATPKQVELRAGESAAVDIKLTRDNYEGPVEMNVILWNLTQRFSKLPEGIVFEEKKSKTSLGSNETRGRVVFRAEPDAPALDDYLMAVIGQITYNRVFMTRVAAPFRLTVKRENSRRTTGE